MLDKIRKMTLRPASRFPQIFCLITWKIWNRNKNSLSVTNKCTINHVYSTSLSLRTYSHLMNKCKETNYHGNRFCHFSSWENQIKMMSFYLILITTLIYSGKNNRWTCDNILVVMRNICMSAITFYFLDGPWLLLASVHQWWF